jgi:hypothetical protein
MSDEITLRDTFAAAALTGLISSREWPIDSDEAAHYCYRIADAMLRERGGTEPMPKEKRAEVSYTLTAEEREAIKACESDYSDNDMDAECWRIAATLRDLLERLE